jgi:hypothetical protein
MSWRILSIAAFFIACPASLLKDSTGASSELDPLSLTVNVQVGYILFLARRYDEAITQLRAAIDMDPYFWMAHAAIRRYRMRERNCQHDVHFAL